MNHIKTFLLTKVESSCGGIDAPRFKSKHQSRKLVNHKIEKYSLIQQIQLSSFCLKGMVWCNAHDMIDLIEIIHIGFLKNISIT